MLRKLFVAALSACILFTVPIHAAQSSAANDDKVKEESITDSPRDSLDDAMITGARFVMWSNMFGVPGITSSKPKYEYFSEDTTDLYIDDLAISYDNDTSIAENVSLFYDYDKCDESHQTMKALAFFAAVEYDTPIKWTMAEKGKVFEETSKIFNKMCSSYEENQKKIESGTMVAFHYSKCGTYYFSYNKKVGLMLSIKDFKK